MKKAVLLLSMIAVLGASSFQLMAHEGTFALCREKYETCVATSPMYAWGDCMEDFHACVQGW